MRYFRFYSGKRRVGFKSLRIPKRFIYSRVEGWVAGETGDSRMDPSIGRFTCSGGKRSPVNGTFAYINLFLSSSVPSERRLFHESFQWVLTAEGEKFYLSLNGNRTPTCYLLWEDFLGCCSPELVGDRSEGFTHRSSGARSVGVYSFWIKFREASIYYR